ncbi:MAG: neutral/alkaline non-lysosomal ceramidase N-terminal domain-containing protein, partial [Silvanigrellaceae bacterium]|nr:neutral/alkaline non-lysosomal ceramidase N-terminal domain-containing protein [Silvanigrellaceae bacterium]
MDLNKRCFIFITFALLIVSCRVETRKNNFIAFSDSSGLFYNMSSEKVSFDSLLSSTLEIGIDAETIEPLFPTSLSGFGGIARRLLAPFFHNIGESYSYCKPYTSIDREPRVKVIALSGRDSIDNTQKNYIIISYDIVAVPSDLSLKLLKTLQHSFPNLNLSENNLQIIATHTHSGPAGLTENPLWSVGVCDRFNKKVYSHTIEQTLLAFENAIRNKQKMTRLQVSSITVDNINKSRVKNMPVDQKSLLITFQGPDSDKSLGCLQTFSVHPTWYGVNDLTLSSDLAGYIENALE